MQHLSLEALARLVDEPPAPEEARHVRDCLVCRRELDELRLTTASLGEMEDDEPPAELWLALEARLETEGLIRVPAIGSMPAPAVAPRRAASTPWMRYAAALALFVGGGATGALVWSRGGPVPGTPAALPPVAAAGPESAPARNDEPVAVIMPPLPGAETPAPAAAGNGARLVSDGGPPPVARSHAATPRTTPAPNRAGSRELARAEAELRDVQAQYLAVLQRYAALADERSGADPATRLAALDRLLALTGAALERTPEDPVVNGYHLAALSARQALQRQMDATGGGGAEWF